MSVITCIHKLQRIGPGPLCACRIQWSTCFHPREGKRSLEYLVLMLIAGYLARNWNSSTVPLMKMKTHLWGWSMPTEPGTWNLPGPAFVETRSWPSGLQSVRFAVLAPLWPCTSTSLCHATQLWRLVSIPPTHPPTSSLCGLSKPGVDSYHFQTLLAFLLPFKGRLFSSLIKRSFSTFFPFLPIGLCWGEQLKVRKKPGFLGWR